jgi:hypothetical protein
VIGKCANLRKELRQMAENQRSGCTVDIEGSGRVIVIWRRTGRPQVEASIDWRKTLAGAV